MPAACFWWASRIFLARSDGRVVRLLECGAALFATLLVLLQIRHALQDGVIGAERWGFLEAALQLCALFACAWVALLLHRRGGRVAMLWAARAAGATGLVLGAVLLANNPWTTNEDIAGPLLLNALLPPMPSRRCWWRWRWRARRKRACRRAWKSCSRSTRWSRRLRMSRWKCGAPSTRPISAGRASPRPRCTPIPAPGWFWARCCWRWASARRARRSGSRLGVIALTTLKVFLVDMDALVGLWRVLSFLGLGLALIALGAIYRRFVTVAPAGNAPADAMPSGTPGDGSPPDAPPDGPPPPRS